VKVVPDDRKKFFTRLYVLLKSVFGSVRKNREAKSTTLAKVYEMEFLFRNGLAGNQDQLLGARKDQRHISNDRLNDLSDSEKRLN